LSVSGDRVLVTTDQGPGEQILFASLLPDLIRTGAELSVAGDDRLIPLLERSFPAVRFIGRAQPVAGSVDYQFTLPDAAKWFRTSFDSFPRLAGYLKPDPYTAGVLRRRYREGTDTSPLLAGISWRTVTGTKVSAQKTIPLDRWRSILTIPGVRFVDLQYGDAEQEVRAAESAFGVRVLKDPAVNATLDLDSLAAQISGLDLVITTSNTTAHIAAALNIPTWVLIPKGHGGFWHWFLDRDDSPWYPSVRLFRQNERGEWQPVLDKVAAELSALTEMRRPAS
jgi:hypothetical protein